MKYAFPVPCPCGETFLVHVIGVDLPKDAHCPACDATIWLVEPLGNVVGMAILGRASSELKSEDWTLAIVLSAMAVECELAFLFMKWNRIELTLQRNPTDPDEELWENQWREIRSLAKRLDKVSTLLTQNPFDFFLAQQSGLLKGFHAKYPDSASASSQRDLFVKELFHRRNRIVHFGKIDFQKSEAEVSVAVASTLWQILDAMDKSRAHALDASFQKPAAGKAT